MSKDIIFKICISKNYSAITSEFGMPTNKVRRVRERVDADRNEICGQMGHTPGCPSSLMTDLYERQNC